jgi:hypothetical protein
MKLMALLFLVMSFGLPTWSGAFCQSDKAIAPPLTFDRPLPQPGNVLAPVPAIGPATGPATAFEPVTSFQYASEIEKFDARRLETPGTIEDFVHRQPPTGDSSAAAAVPNPGDVMFMAFTDGSAEAAVFEDRSADSKKTFSARRRPINQYGMVETNFQTSTATTPKFYYWRQVSSDDKSCSWASKQWVSFEHNGNINWGRIYALFRHVRYEAERWALVQVFTINGVDLPYSKVLYLSKKVGSLKPAQAPYAKVLLPPTLPTPSPPTDLPPPYAP